MQVTVELHDVLIAKINLDSMADSGCFNISVPEGSNIYSLLNVIGLDASLVGLIIVNQKQASLTYELADSDVIKLFSPMAGG